MNTRNLIVLLIMCITLAGCDKMPANGYLDGMWQVMEIEHNGDTRNVSQDQIYMSIQLKLFQLGNKANPYLYYGYFTHEGDSMKLWQFSYASVNESETDNNVPIPESGKAVLNKWGFYSLKESFKVDKLTRDLLIMHNDSSTIHYIKF